MKKRIHVNQHVLKKNAKEGTNEPAITVKTYKSNHYTDDVLIEGLTRVVQRDEDPLSCGAKVWIETDADVKIRKADGTSEWI